jgi:adenylate cyclase
VRALATRLIGIADDPQDDDDTRLRKRIGVAAGYVTIIAPLTLPIQALGHPLSYVLAAGLSIYSALNLLVLARTKRFERYVVALIGSGPIFVPLASAVGGGLLGSSAGPVWGFLVPAYAILALGPRRATPWFIAFLASLLVMAIADPYVREVFGPAPYMSRLTTAVMNTAIPLAIVFLMLRYTDVRRRQAEARSEELLTNAIPPSIARRLRRGERRIAEAYPEATVIFADIVAFTPWAGRTDPGRVVSLLDDLFTRFDAATNEVGLEKIKTMGDAYMAVAGAPEPMPDHAQAAISLAELMLDEAAAWRQANGVELEVRIGLASGAVVGGVIGDRRILFDLWGSTVNTASRMESFGVASRIQMSASTRELLPESNRFETRDVEVKGIGNVRTYLLVSSPVDGRRSTGAVVR